MYVYLGYVNQSGRLLNTPTTERAQAQQRNTKETPPFIQAQPPASSSFRIKPNSATWRVYYRLAHTNGAQDTRTESLLLSLTRLTFTTQMSFHMPVWKQTGMHLDDATQLRSLNRILNRLGLHNTKAGGQHTDGLLGMYRVTSRLVWAT